MIEGLDHDDKFRMVEDEFVAIAKIFTAQRHQAAYEEQQNAAKISPTARPVVGKMTDNTRRKIERLAQSKVQRDVLGRLKEDSKIASDTDSEDEVLPYVGTSLHVLMDSPKKAMSLSKFTAGNSATRAAAGFRAPTVQIMGRSVDRSQSQVEGSTEDGHDSKVPPPRPEFRSVRLKSPVSSRLAESTKSESAKRTQRCRGAIHSTEFPPDTPDTAPSEDDELSQAAAASRARIERRMQARLARSGQAQGKEAALDSIPSFL